MIAFQSFYLGTHEPSWLRTAGVPLFVSHRRLARLRSLPRAAAGWALDSGGFSELQLYGEWRTTPERYVAAVRRYDEEIGNLNWAAPQDWMCEPTVIAGGQAGPVRFAGTHLSIAEHQRRTVDNFVQLRWLWADDETCPFMPVVQGWQLDDYLRCVDLYETAGVRLADFPVVGVGSVCRRQDTDSGAEIFDRLFRHMAPAAGAMSVENNLHGFGVKSAGLARYASHLGSADSLAWSYGARRTKPLPGCTHSTCANCLRYALAWRRRIMHGLFAQGLPFDSLNEFEEYAA